MRITSYVAGAVIVGALLVAWTGGRLSERLLVPLALARDIVIRLSTSVLFSVVASDAARHGGVGWIFFPFLVLLAAFGFVLSGGWIWMWATRGLEDGEPSGGD